MVSHFMCAVKVLFFAVGGFGAEEITEGLEVVFSAYRVAKTVTGFGDGDDLFRRAAGSVEAAAHAAGDVLILFTVEEDHRHGAFF